jgi:hypothetical protein
MISFTTVTWYSQLFAIILAVGIFALGILIGVEMGKRQLGVQQDAVRETPSSSTAEDIRSFAWSHATDESGDIPKSTVSLVMTREDGISSQQQIAIVDGSCNEMPVETPLALGSGQLLCYYAGFGYQYRVIEENGAYAVQQKEIEEASPDYNPPIADFVTVLTLDKSGEVFAQ